MREILFRGKSLLDDEWIYGFYYNIDDSLKGKRRHIIVHEGEGIGYTTKHEPINPDTLGMYIGLKDKHGNKIFTGDIFSGGFDGDPRIVEWGEPEASFYIYDNGNTHYFEAGIKSTEEEIIGNIHDNPELFEE